MAEYTSIQLAQADINTTATTQAVNNSRDFHDTIGEGLLVTATAVGVVFAVLISAAVAAYTHNKARVRRVRVLPSKAKQGGNWAMQARSALQSSHSGKK